MSIIPMLLEGAIDPYYGGSRATNWDVEDIIEPLSLALGQLRRHRPKYYRPWRATRAADDSGSTITTDHEKFQVELDVSQFKPDEMTVSVSEGTVNVEGKHEEKEDEHGTIYRHFLRRYVLPKGLDKDNVVSNLSTDGVLTITVPKLQAVEQKRVIPIKQTGKPSKAVTEGVTKTHTPIQKAKDKMTTRRK